jgi:hypothetical protein
MTGSGFYLPRGALALPDALDQFLERATRLAHLLFSYVDKKNIIF